MRHIRKFILGIITIYFIATVMIILFPSLLIVLPEEYRKKEYFDILSSVIVPVGSVLALLLLFMTYLIQKEDQDIREKAVKQRIVRIKIIPFKTKVNGNWIIALKIVFINISIANIYLSNFKISYFLQSSPDKKDMIASGPIKIKLENGDFEEKIFYPTEIFQNEMKTGNLLVKVILTDSFDNEFKSSQIVINENQEGIINIMLY